MLEHGLVGFIIPIVRAMIGLGTWTAGPERSPVPDVRGEAWLCMEDDESGANLSTAKTPSASRASASLHAES